MKNKIIAMSERDYYIKQIIKEKQNAQDIYEMYKALMESFELANKEINNLKHKLESVKSFAIMYNNDSLCKQILDILED